MSGNELYTLNSKDFFESPERTPVSARYMNHIRLLVPNSWRITLAGWWTYVFIDESSMPGQGFKIHISSNFENAVETLNKVVPVLVENKCSFKFITGPEMFFLGLNKTYGRSGSGKLLTIYPYDIEKFKTVIEALYQATLGNQGPYILSDMKYKDSQVVFYRYGGFKSRSKLHINGTRESLLINNEGEDIRDERLPYYKLPDWVTDPFNSVPDISKLSAPLLNQRYMVQSVFKHSNSGGVYLALDKQTDAQCIIKEARPGVGLAKAGAEEYLDGKSVLKREADVLRKLQSLSVTPDFIDFFEQQTHSYLALSIVKGQTLNNFRARDNIMLMGKSRSEEVLEFINFFAVLTLNLIEAVDSIHSKGIIIGDLSAANILIDPDTLGISIIDFETSWDCCNGAPDLLVSDWGTAGYRNKKSKKDDNSTSSLKKDDWHSLSLCLYSCILPNNNLIELDESKLDLMLNEISNVYGLPKLISHVLLHLSKGDPLKAKQKCFVLKNLSTNDLSPMENYKRLNLEEILQMNAHVLNGVVSFIQNNASPLREDRLWPSGIEVFLTNLGNLAFGAAGIQVFLEDVGQDSRLYNFWWDREKTKVNYYPPGFHSGLAGIAYLYGIQGEFEEAKSIFNYVSNHKLRFSDMTWVYGEAGILHTALFLFYHTNDSFYLDEAHRSANYLYENTIKTNKEARWLNSSSKPLHPGFADGASGICWALYQYYEATHDQSFRSLAISGLDYINSFSEESRGRPIWYLDESKQIHTPYWHRGAAGIGSVFIRIGHKENLPHLTKRGIEAIEGAFSRFTVSCDQYRGISGIGESLLDVFSITNHKQYLYMACAIAKTIQVYAIERDDGIAFPGFRNKRLQCDYAGGSAGIASFLLRLRNSTGRRFIDIY